MTKRPPKIRLTLDVTRDEYEKLERLRLAFSVSKSDVLRSALRLFDRMTDADGELWVRGPGGEYRLELLP